MKNQGSAIWGGATLGFVVGLILGFFVGNYWTTVLYAVLIGATSGLVANVLAWPGNIVRLREMKRRESAGRAASESVLDRTVEEHLFETSEDYRTLAVSHLESVEDVLRNVNLADLTTQHDRDGLYELVCGVEDGENWRAGYDSLEAFYAAHKARHPKIRVYADLHRERDGEG